MLNGGIKLRERYFRIVENNVIVNNFFQPHVWFIGSEDIFRHNIVFKPYQPIRIPQPWGKENDYNLLHVPGMINMRSASTLQQSGRDEHSLKADALFVDPALSGTIAVSCARRSKTLRRLRLRSPPPISPSFRTPSYGDKRYVTRRNPSQTTTCSGCVS